MGQEPLQREDKHGVNQNHPELPASIPGSTSVLTNGGREFPDGNESEDFSGVKKIRQQTAKDSADKANT